eukprot:791992-Prorocentrum_minimum.AAC.3
MEAGAGINDVGHAPPMPLRLMKHPDPSEPPPHYYAILSSLQHYIFRICAFTCLTRLRAHTHNK